jgi:hypothetical protein
MLVAPPPTFSRAPFAWLKWSVAPQLFYSKIEMDNLSRTRWFFQGEAGYQVLPSIDKFSNPHEQAIQGTKPQSLSYGLWDSPIALLSWIREKLQTWSDSYPWTENEIITWVMIYWITQVTGGLRIYKQGDVPRITGGYVPVPLGVCVFPKEIFVAPKGNGLGGIANREIGLSNQGILSFTGCTKVEGLSPWVCNLIFV